ncbi:MFS transporter [Cytophagales bacterium WSM2-2]|nr:MFS transporter [Cytophagales bacterium WSM2-2]
MNSEKTFFGHPRGLATLFFTEMWERFSYYGMRALLLLFMVGAIDNGGMGMDEKTGGAVYGLYTMFVYLLSLPGGWLADNLFGLRKSVFYGGCLITIGHFCLAFPYTQTFFIGLLFIVMGTGMLKPNISSLVGELYPISDQAKRDAGFSIFFMGINIGATIAPIITSYLGEKINWHYGFAAAGIGMLCGLIQFRATEKYLGEAGLYPSKLSDPVLQSKREKKIKIGLGVFGVLLTGFVTLLMMGAITINPVAIARTSTYVLTISVVVYFAYILLFEDLSQDEKNKVKVIAIFFLASATFYGGYEQQGSTLSLFADRYTDRFIGTFEFPSGWFQTVPPTAVVIFVPIFAWLWVWLAKRNANPSTPVKLSLGLFFMGLGYLVMMGASMVIVAGSKALPTWLVITYVFHTFGEICLYPIGLSAVSKLSPKKLLGQMMGVWFVSLALGNLTAGLFAGEFDDKAIAADPGILVNLFWMVVRAMFIGALAVFLLSKPLRKLMGNIQ